ncbi:hypothetical protein SEPCBS119000_003377 [Sporothrix epigloea]|uniref:WD40 domain-containing protein n=1 Tax=Sporothrix epigloea TaxID=1892477 RepID=A0ABP0DPY3_9PEZI
MRFSQAIKASSHCLPSPDGQLIATLLPDGIHLRTVEHLDEVASVVALPADLSVAAVVSFQWSPSSKRLLVATSDLLLVAAVDSPADESSFRAIVRNPTLPLTAKPTFVEFGPSDDCVCICSAYGIKFFVYDLCTGEGVAIENPKLFSSAAVCSRGVSFRPVSQHMALLVRTDGKDYVCIRNLARPTSASFWEPDTIDAQGLAWSPDGSWLAVWESPAHGHKILFYTPDGHLYRIWTGVTDGLSRWLPKTASNAATLQTPPSLATGTETAAGDELLGSGVRLVQFSANARHLAAGDASRTVRIINMISMTTHERLNHPTCLRPRLGVTCPIWQEQIESVSNSNAGHRFVKATHDVSPPGRSPSGSIDSAGVSSGCTLLAFDCSSTLLATRLEEAPSTVWVWDMNTAELCGVLMVHANVSTVVWHSTQAHTLLVTCDGDKHSGLGVVWNPLKDAAPQTANFLPYLTSEHNKLSGPPSTQQTGNCRLNWLNLKGVPPSLFCSNASKFCVVAIDEDDYHGYQATDSIPWPEADAPQATAVVGGKRWLLDERGREESPLELVPADVETEGDSEINDTFQFKKED